MKNILFFHVIFFGIVTNGFCQDKRIVFPLDNASGIYSMEKYNEKLITNVSFKTLYNKDSEGNIASEKDYYYEIAMGGKDFCVLKVFLKEESVCIETRYQDQSSTVFCTELAKFEGPSGSLYIYQKFTENTVTRILFERNLKVFIVVNIPINYNNKTYILHLKPGTL